jgi:DNA-directed RNA polymerase specialized sigma24 family protein
MDPRPADQAPATLRAAFSDLHGGRLYGFALLVTLGDRDAAARLARGALVAAGPHADELRHPERAAAWLRAWVVRTAGGRYRSLPRSVDGRAGLTALGVDDATYAALAALAVRERAAIVASVVERLDARDVGVVVERDIPSLDRLLVRARRRFMERYAAHEAEGPPPAGPYADRLSAAAARALR